MLFFLKREEEEEEKTRHLIIPSKSFECSHQNKKRSPFRLKTYIMICICEDQQLPVTTVKRAKVTWTRPLEFYCFIYCLK